MKIKMTCIVHPTSDVLFLEGTVKFLSVSGAYVDEATEKGVEVEIDMANLYCTGDNPYGKHEFIPFIETSPLESSND